MRLLLASVLALLALAPEVSAAPRIYAVTGEAQPQLLSFDPAAPGTILASQAITGLGATEIVHGMDLRPATGTLYLLTSAGLRPLDAATGAAAAAIPLSADPSDSTAPFAGFSGSTGAGVDFNPVVDRLRVIDRGGQNLRVNPSNGLVTTDGTINPGTPEIVAAGYANSFPGASTTTLYAYAFAGSQLVTVNPPNSGTVVTVGPTGIAPEWGLDTGMDLSPDGNVAFLSAQSVGVWRLWTLNLATGAATLVGSIGNGTVPIRDITALENLVGPAEAGTSAQEAAPTAKVAVVRSSARLGATVQYATADGTATAGADYAATSGTLTFGPGEAVETIEVPLVADAGNEPDETFTVTLSNLDPGDATTATLLGTASTVTIADDDAPAAAVPDRDGDGVPDETDTCPNVADPAQADGDRDGLGTACDLSEVAPPPIVVPPPDATPPAVLATAPARISRSQVRRGRVRVRFSCDRACVVTARLVFRKRTYGRGTAGLTKAGVGTLVLGTTGGVTPIHKLPGRYKAGHITLTQSSTGSRPLPAGRIRVRLR